MLTILDKIPEGLLNARATELQDVLSGPTLIQLKGAREPAVWLGCLMHGNEYTGLLVLQELMKKYGETDWPRSVFLFFGNVAAAKEGQRHLDGQVDYNRIWRGGDLPEHRMAKQVLDHVRPQGLFASIDIHNNTGRNPYYAIVTTKDPRYLYLASQFSDIALYFTEERGTHTEVFANLCPTVTLESGLPGKPEGTEHVLKFVEGVLHMEEVPVVPVKSLNLSLMDIVATVRLAPETTVGLGEDKADIVFEQDFDKYNFTELSQGHFFGRYQDGHKLIVTDKDGKDVGDFYFDYLGGEIRTTRPLIPAMITLEKKILKSDCVCYLMEKIEL